MSHERHLNFMQRVSARLTEQRDASAPVGPVPCFWPGLIPRNLLLIVVVRLIQEGVQLFDRLIVAVGVNPDKKHTFTAEDRLTMIRESCRSCRNVEVAAFSNLYLIHYAESVGATHILRGIRSAGDYEFERTMRNLNGDLDDGICTVFLMPPRDIAEVSSSMVKGLIGPAGPRLTTMHCIPTLH